MPRPELADLREGQIVYPVDLSRAEAVALNACRLVKAEADEDGWRVTAEHSVGVLRRGDLVVRVSPKVGTLQLLALLGRAYGVTGLRIDDSVVDLADDADLSSVLAALFVREAESALAAGPLRGYQTEHQTLSVLRGRLRLREQFLRRFGLPVPLEVTVDEWTTDAIENRRIRAASHRLALLPDLPRWVRSGLLRLDRVLADVRLPAVGSTLEAWIPTRLNARMHSLLHLSDLVLSDASVEHDAGSTETRGFVINMAWLFEKLVTQVLGEEFRGLKPQDTLDLDTLGRLYIKPDLVFYRDGVPIAVGDTKYKLLDDDGTFPNADAYQLVTYCTRLGLAVGHLIYAAGDPLPDPFNIAGAGVRLVVHSVDVTKPISEIECQVAEVGRTMLAESFSDAT